MITLSILSNLSRTSLIKIKMPNKMFPCVGHHSLRNVRADWALAAPLAHILLDWRQIWQKIKSMQGFAGPRYIWKYHFVFHPQRITQELQQTAPQMGQISLIWGQISLVCKQTSPACEQIGLICEQISPIYAQISLVWEQISLICKQTNLICEQLLLICGQMNHICENILPFLAFSTFQCFHSMLSVSNLTKYLSVRGKQWNYIICHWISWQHVHASHSYMSVSLFTISQYIYSHI